MIAVTKRRYIWLFLLIPLFWHGLGCYVEACEACWSGHGSGDERFNRPLTDLRKIYEKEGRNALPHIRQALMKSPDPLVIRRAAGYIVELGDTDSIPLFEEMLLALVKKGTFSTFGLGTHDSQRRLIVAHALVKFGPTETGDRIWEKYDRLGVKRKSEVPYILNALEDPKLIERLLEIVNRKENHLLMMGALSVLAIGGTTEALAALRSKVEERTK
jgi:HEAT repeat protein